VSDRSSQLSLFEPPDPVAPAEPDRGRLADTHREAAAIASRLPRDLHFGTSSWTFPGWRGLVYSSEMSQSALAREGLREYAAHPLLTTVGIDRSYYAPVPDEDLRRYAEQLPDRFLACAKAPAAVTSPMLFDGARRASPNPDYFSAERLATDLLEPFARSFATHTGPFILEFPPPARDASIDPVRFADQLDRFLEGVPKQFEFGVELRSRRLLTDAYRRVLARHRAAHVYNYWSFMPMPGAQAEIVPPDGAGFVIVRLLLRPGTRYEDQREIFRPFNRLVEPDDDMRLDVTRLLKRALAAGKRAYVLVNNKAEGSSPLTVRALAQLMVE
jgi:uncharacterized protein YecE (DUF72 family)